MKAYEGLLAFVVSIACFGAQATDYFVDAEGGHDGQPGTSEKLAWQTLERVNSTRLKPGDRVRFKSGQVWRGSLKVQPGAKDAPVTYTSYPGTGKNADWKPRIIRSVDLTDPALWRSAGRNIWKTLPAPDGADGRVVSIGADVGNIILMNRGEDKKRAGFKRWAVEELKTQGDFFSSPLSPGPGPRTLYFYSEKNPAERYSMIEAAPKINTITMNRPEWFVLDGLAFGYTSAHGIGGANAKNVQIRACDFFWIGGGHLYMENGVPVRYGNGVELWCEASDCVVERCRFWQIYDTAMTNQGNEKCRVNHIVWRENTVYLCEQAYEIWFSSPEAEIAGLVYENNRSFDCGFGWGHEQRPFKNGTHLLAYRLEPKKIDIHYRNNQFCHSANELIWFFNARLNEIDCTRNVYWQDGPEPEKQPLFTWSGIKAPGVAFDAYKAKTRNDADSRFEKIERVPYFDY